LLHGCTVGDSTLIANGAMVLDRVSIGSHCLVAAGAMVPPGKVIPDGSVVMGMPGKVVREVNDKDRAMMAHIAEHYMTRAQWYRRELAVDPRSATAGPLSSADPRRATAGPLSSADPRRGTAGQRDTVSPPEGE
jgi:hypothetical protein